MTVIGITGATGAGKTTLLRYLETLGAVVFDCDKVYYEIAAAETSLGKELQKTFGDVFLPSGLLNREALGKLVFTEETQLKKLNALVYYHLSLEIRQRLMAAKGQGKTLCVIDAVNLMDSGLGELCTVTVAVTASPEVRLGRIMARDGITKEQALRRMNAQKQDYAARTKLSVENNGAEEAFLAKAKALLAPYLEGEVL